MSPHRPPTAAERLLGLALREPRAREAMLGDLSEEFSALAARVGRSAARRWYWQEALRLAVRFTFAPPLPGRRRRAAPSWSADSGGHDDGRLRWAPLRDLRFAWRALSHQPALSLTIVLTLATALAANASIFAIGDALVLRPFRFDGLDRAVLVSSTGQERFFDRESVAAADFLEWRDRTGDVFERLAAMEWWEASVSGHGLPEPVVGFRVSADLFAALGVQPPLGRIWTAAEEQPGAEPRVVLSHGFWVRRFAGDPAIVGRTIRIDGAPHVIVGVAPPAFRVPFSADLWAPRVFTPEEREARARGRLMVVGRLQPGVTIPAAQARLESIAAGHRAAYPDTHATRQVTVRSLRDGLGDPGAGPFIAAWQAAALLLLLVACANVANLLLARGSERSRELAIRLALGASRLRLVWQLLLEGALLAAAASLAAVPLAWAALGAFRAAMPAAVVRYVTGWEHLQIDTRTLLLTTLLAALAAIVSSAAPALGAVRASASAGLRIGGRGQTDTPRRARGRAGLAIAQIAVTVALVSAAVLSVSALTRVTTGPLGFDPERVLTGEVSLSEHDYDDPEKRRRFTDQVLERLRARPAVRSAAFTSTLPYGGGNQTVPLWEPGEDPTIAGAVEVNYRRVSPAFYETLRIPILQGRGVTHADRPDSLPVAVVSRTLAERHWPGESALGKEVRLAPDAPWRTVVGVAGDVSHDWLIEPHRPTVYLPAAQAPPYSLDFTVRTVGDPLELAADLAAAVQSVDPDQAVAGLRSFEQVIADKTVGLRVASRTLSTIAAVSFGVSVLGVYGLLSFLASRRTREFGVRIALGATPADVAGLTLRQGASITAAGLLAGLGLAALLNRTLESALFGVVSTSVPLMLGAASVLALAALAAAYLPARRAAGVDPVVALRAE